MSNSDPTREAIHSDPQEKPSAVFEKNKEITVAATQKSSGAVPKIKESARSFGDPEVDFRVYQRLAEMMAEGKHGKRWQTRQFSPDPIEAVKLDPFGVMRIDRPFLPIRNKGAELSKPYI